MYKPYIQVGEVREGGEDKRAQHAQIVAFKVPTENNHKKNREGTKIITREIKGARKYSRSAFES